MKSTTAHGVDRCGGSCSSRELSAECAALPGGQHRHDDGARAAQRQRRCRASRVLDEAVRREARDRRQARGSHDSRRRDSLSAAAAHGAERGHDDQSHGAQAEQAGRLHRALRQGGAQIRSAAHRARDNAADLRDRPRHISHGARRRFTDPGARRQPSSALLARAAARGEEMVRAEAAAEADACAGRTNRATSLA